MTTYTLSWDDMTDAQKASREYGFVSDVTGTQTKEEGGNTYVTTVYRRTPREITNLGRVISWQREWVWPVGE